MTKGHAFHMSNNDLLLIETMTIIYLIIVNA